MAGVDHHLDLPPGKLAHQHRHLVIGDHPCDRAVCRHPDIDWNQRLIVPIGFVSVLVGLAEPVTAEKHEYFIARGGPVDQPILERFEDVASGRPRR